jgi:hypothetical protein
MARGSHKSATEYIDFLNEEMTDMVNKQYWVVLPYKHVRHLPNLRISPLGVVPQRNRRPRTIVDYTFSGVNPEAKRLAHREAMQYGHALERLLHRILHADAEHGPVYMIKIDLSDGFYRVPLRPADIPTLGVAYPSLPGAEKLVAFPLVLPMGWTESAPFFCTATETATDLANAWMTDGWDPPLHPLESAASTPAVPAVPDERPVMVLPPPARTTKLRQQVLPPASTHHKRRKGKRQPLAYADVFVDDEIMLGQGSPAKLNRLRRIMLHCNDMVFRPNDDSDDLAGRKEPVSVSKLQKGDASWATYKILLGWVVDSLRKTIELPPHRRDRLLEILQAARGRKRIGLQDCHRLLGELRSMVLGIPGGRGLFSQLQLALRQVQGSRVKLHREARHQIEDFWVLAQDLASRPTRIAELLPTDPAFVGACDAAKSGLGGVWLPPKIPSEHTPSHPPLLWRWPVPDRLQALLISEANPKGTITNSDLELAGTLAQEDILVHSVDCREKTIATMCDNTPAVAWRRKGSVTTPGPASYLLREACLQQRRHRHVSLVSYIPGPINAMADDASRRFDLTDMELLAHFEKLYPQDEPWQMRRLTPDIISRLTSALLRQRPGRPSPVTEHVPQTQCGISHGSRTSNPYLLQTPSSATLRTKYPYSGSSPKESGTDAAAEAATRSALATYVTSYSLSRRRTPNWGPRIPDTPERDSWTHDCPAYLKAWEMTTPPQTE